MKNRLFIALEIPDDVLDALINLREEIYSDDSNVKWEPREKLHITLKFLGEIDLEMNNKIIKSLEESLLDNEKIQIAFDKFGIFYRFNKPKILWVGIQQNHQLFSKFNIMENDLEKLGIKKEKRRFKPHLTLLRIKGNENLAEIEKFNQHSINGLSFNVENILLIKSRLHQTGSVYETIRIFEMN